MWLCPWLLQLCKLSWKFFHRGLLGKYVKYNPKLTYRSDCSLDFHAWWLKWRGLIQGVPFLAFVDIAAHLVGKIVLSETSETHICHSPHSSDLSITSACKSLDPISGAPILPNPMQAFNWKLLVHYEISALNLLDFSRHGCLNSVQYIFLLA